ncbi:MULTISPECIES: aminotransferase class I/II-fold pyridoxal phosphate-dependent enzyme [Actinosynnema]|uniref:aminotransferase class I/II-fold pyridoxal phosphate-dependent enzyme n=1 Tax=Actinosynnema TaxID=40566 RepID=UPI0020A29769|nr:aminotransferase class I/II-fold pyridoxal phosphate-dependent enzyme [Actinosynnema pretiosum]MCP2097311.1 dTDP-4-amino-4,6-dideoxygalactose transaminase [Actinosynnema pretiosum]
MSTATPPTPICQSEHIDGVSASAARAALLATTATPRELEERLAAHWAREAVLAPSGTVAMSAALGAAGVGRGHEVLVGAVSWPRLAPAVAALGAVAVPVDVDPLSLTLSPAALDWARTPATRAVVLTHHAGHPADLDRLERLARRWGSVPVVEDLAHGIGGTWGRTRVGGLPSATAAVLSFDAGSLLPGVRGGAVLSRTGHHAEQVRALLAEQRARTLALEHPDGPEAVRELAAGPHLGPSGAALVLAALGEYSARWTVRHRGRVDLLAALAGRHDGLAVPVRAQVAMHDHHALLLRVPPEAAEAGVRAATLAAALTAAGVPAHPAVRPWREQPLPPVAAERLAGVRTPVADLLATSLVAVPHTVLEDPARAALLPAALDALGTEAAVERLVADQHDLARRAPTGDLDPTAPGPTAGCLPVRVP